jgi:hypothetical protein
MLGAQLQHLSLKRGPILSSFRGILESVRRTKNRPTYLKGFRAVCSHGLPAMTTKSIQEKYVHEYPTFQNKYSPSHPR